MSITIPEVPLDDVVAWRRHLHANPELSFKEFETSDFLIKTLKQLGVESSKPTKTSVVGVIQGTKTIADPTRMIALRADTDALPVQEETGLPFASKVPGVMHACGHDAHTAMLLGTAAALIKNRDQFGGTVKLIFQHAEEQNPGGARDLVAAGVLQGVARIYGFHVMNGPVGTVAVSRGAATSSAGGFFLTIQGQGSHGSMPHKGVDPVVCAAQVVVALNHIVGRNMDPNDMVVVNPGMVQSGEAPNVIPDTAKLGCSIRTTSTEASRIAYQRAEQVVKGICLAYGCSYRFEWVRPYDVVINDDDCVEVVLKAAAIAVGEDNVNVVPASGASEDFSAYTAVVPGAFVLINGGDQAQGLPFANHHPKFDVVEHPTLSIGCATQLQIVLHELGA
ncbi:MAG: amidohydrolase [Propionibacteriaceae bacterium]|nr:amidohydrolase [Propionibacteriaceae bacterium]